MLIEASIWNAFHEAKGALLEALRSSPTGPPHVLSAVPRSRETIRASTAELIFAITDAQRELQAAQDELEAAQTLLSQWHFAAKNSLSPIGALPPELIYMIMSYASEEPNPLHVLRISHVSKLWRRVVISDPTSFTCADWERWNDNLVELWCTRAGSQPLTIGLGHSAMCEIVDNRRSKLNHLLTSRIPQLRRLDIHGIPSFSEYDRAQRIIDICSSEPAPLLKHMRIHIGNPWDCPHDSQSLEVEQNAMPAFCVLDLGDNIGPVHVGRRDKLKAFAFNMYSVGIWPRWRRMLHGFRNLEDLCIRAPRNLDSMFPPQPNSPTAALPSLRHLELVDVEIRSEMGLIRLLAHLTTPGLRAVTLSYPQPLACQYIYEGLVSIFLSASGFVSTFC